MKGGPTGEDFNSLEDALGHADTGDLCGEELGGDLLLRGRWCGTVKSREVESSRPLLSFIPACYSEAV